MSFWKHAKVLGPLLSVVIVGVCIGSSLTGYELPSYEIEAHAAQAEEEEPAAAADDEIMTAGNWELDDGVYRGTGVGYAGEVTVDVTIADKTITQINIVSESDDDAFFNRAKGVIDKIISSQSLEVDVVSGATYSSNGIINAVKNALTGEKDNSKKPDPVEPKGSAAVSEVTESAAYRDGTYYGTGTGFGGELTVKVVIRGGKIVSVEVVSHKDDEAYFNQAKALLVRIVETQSTNVDTVSGATYSSAGIIQATRDALGKAAVEPSDARALASDASGGSSVNNSNSANADVNAAPSVMGNFPYLDGTYTGTAEGWGGDITVSVTIKDQTMTNIEVMSHEDETEIYFYRAMGVVSRMLQSQSTDVDVVSGATYSSNGIMNAVKEALKAADEAANGTGSKTNQPDWGQDEGNENPGTENNNGTGDGKSDDTVNDSTGNTGGTIYKNGTYSGSARCTDFEYMEFDYELGLTVTVENDRITDISDITEDGVLYTNGTANKAYLKRAAEGRSSFIGLVSQIIGLKTIFDNTKLNLDTMNLSSDENTINAVSGATYSSESIYYAVKNALEQAKISEGKE